MGGSIWKGLTRTAAWLLMMAVSFLPIKDAANVRLSFSSLPSHYYDLSYQSYEVARRVALQVNDAGLFRDLFFLMIIFTVTSFVDLLYDFVLNRQATLPIWVKCLKVVFCLYYIFVLVWGSKAYVEIVQGHTSVQMPDLKYYCFFVLVTLFITFVAELVIALTDKDEKKPTEQTNRVERTQSRLVPGTQGAGAT